MKTKLFLSIAAVLPLSLFSVSSLHAADAESGAGKTLSLLDTAASGVEKCFAPPVSAAGQVTVSRSQDSAAPGIVVTIQPGPDGYPGINFTPDGKETWDLSQFGHVTAHVVNTGSKSLAFALRVDNKGDWHDSPWNTEGTSIKPGAAGDVTVIFGYSYGRKKGYALKSAEVANMLLFASKSDVVQSFVVESIVAGGPAGEKPPIDPKTVRVKPVDGVILGASVPIDPATQVDAQGGAKASADGKGLSLTFPAGAGAQSVSLKTAMGRWDLTDAAEVRVKMKNTGSTPVTPTIQVSSGGGSTDAITASAPIAPGAEQEVVVPFAATVPAKLYYPAKLYAPCLEKGTGTTFTSDSAGPIKISAAHTGEASLLVESITADAPAAVLPDWLGKRPPVEGDWVKTLDDGFDGTAIDAKTWNIYGENFWDKRTHFSKDNLILGGGVVKQHFEKKRGPQNDDPKQMLALTNPKTSESDYACGFLDTYGKWVQRYGYFEARVKLPVAPGLWPTFWLMPDRGVEAGPQWKRGSTEDGAMEMDIMEHLTRWGPHRYNIANHWDGYGKKHSSNGSTCNYMLPDKDGFITCGMLWTPGLLVYYCNGKEMVRWENPRVSTVPSEIIIETTTGGWDNNAVDDAKLPVDYVIDYVRVWQRKDLASSADGFKSPAKPQAATAVVP